MNIIINHLNKEEHLTIVKTMVLIYTILPTVLDLNPVLSYVTWFMVLYFISSYIRLYPTNVFDDRKLAGKWMLFMIGISWLSVVVLYVLGIRINKPGIWYYFVVDSNKLLALSTAVPAFLYFKNLNLGSISWINRIAASTFGVLQIHANSDAMRQWLWVDLLNNVSIYDSQYLLLHAVCSVVIIFIVCVCIDMLRIAFIEKPLFKYLSKRFEI